VARVKLALDALKKFLQGLMLKVPEIVSVVRKMDRTTQILTPLAICVWFTPT
jgi:hypothetical protein